MSVIGKFSHQWRPTARRNDGLVYKLTRSSCVGDRVYCDLAAGLRVSGILKDWKSSGMAIIEVDQDDVGIEKHRDFVGSRNLEVSKIMAVPVF